MHCFPSFQSASDGYYVNIIQNYAINRALESGKRLHAHLIINGLVRSTHIASKLIDFYIQCRQIHHARKVFDEIPQRNTRSWTVLVSVYARHGFHQEAMGVFCEMQREGLEPNKFVLPSVLKVCGHLSDRRTGEKLHAIVVKQELQSDVFISSALIDMYSKCGRIENARRVFDLMVEIDLVAVNTMVAGCVQHGMVNEALTLVEETRSTGITPDLVTWNTLIAGFSQANDNSTVTKLFQLMQEGGIDPDVVSWTSIISGFVQNLQNHKAFDSFKKMLAAGVHPTSATISSLLPACANLADSIHGKEIHGYSVVTGVEKDVFVCSALIDMYAKCGFIHEAKTLFNNMPERNTITWNSMIFGFANHGYCNKAITLFNQMVDEKVKLDHLTFTAVLTACSQSGMVDFGKKIFLIMQEKFKIKPRLEHYACMVHLLGQEGKLTEAHELIQEMPIEPDLFVWGAFLGACKLHGNVGLAQMAAKHVAKLEPESAGSSLLLSSLYADVGSWGYSARVKHKMKKMKLKTLKGSSWIGSA
ncbi:putative tetratricopeptide-like helical domain superfamily [Helianthus annuus]|uniref:pentatricopeptide repeat-containing protein At5g59600 isoform X2 n=1 Tax=Helianthus annuus TaxID=4232 RepID=UPI000B8F09E3|nr:pentatricopeptide repeat-containing protein At5g59600 isoform X2 [Helianthus annuus]XP_021998236.1 pentatricopeptide repeat-containing protein At5g59600 isoform X1 [Helianthus annuus]KAJ0723904.1 putative tetratricopeptide-like helical domain superfamily [Helianthus annuus]KAJ0903345.1 putative tetratricopeptide-like helical domain superfamily [Helianthus annuus]KAJ0954789.1 putative tetratricopeptide-like helical domain superfamily [Helianthus annuus]